MDDTPSLALHRAAAESRRGYRNVRAGRGMDYDAAIIGGGLAGSEIGIARALPPLAEDRSRIADFIPLGPEAPNDEPARRRLFGED